MKKNKTSYVQIGKTVSIGLDIHRGEAPNTKQKKIMVRNSVWSFYSASSIFIKFSILGAIFQIDESTKSTDVVLGSVIQLTNAL